MASPLSLYPNESWRIEELLDAATRRDMHDAWPIPFLQIFKLSLYNDSDPWPANITRSQRGPGRSMLMEHTEYAVGITELIVAILGTPANSLVLYLALCILSRNRRKKYCQWLVLTMTAFDLLFCLVHAPLMFAQLVLKSPFSVGVCTLMHFCTHASATGSSMSLLLLNLDKFLHLYKPLHYPSLITRRRTIIASLFVSSLAFSWATFLMFGPSMTRGISPSGQCLMKLTVSEVYTFLAVMFFILPTLASLAISIFTASVVVRSRRSQLLLKKAKGDDCQSGSEVEVVGKRICVTSTKQKEQRSVSKTNDPGAPKAQSFLSRFKIIGFVFTTTVWTCLTCLPYRIGYLCYVTGKTPLAPVGHFRMFVMFALMILNAAGNPFVTIITQHQYTEGVRKLVQRCLYAFSARMSTSATSSPCGSKLCASPNTRLTGSPHSLKPNGIVPELNPFLQVPTVHGHLNGQLQLALHVQKTEPKKFQQDRRSC